MATYGTNMGLLPQFSPPSGGGGTPTTAMNPPMFMRPSYRATGTDGTSPAPSGGPTFADIQRTLQPSTGLSPDASMAIDLINKQRDYYAGLGGSQAQALALARGQAGSSTEQFGVQQALTQANIAAMGATTPILTQNMQNNLQQRLQLGQLTSDEIASLRNMDMSNKYMGIQQSLGNRGLDIAQQNIGASRDIAQQQARNSLLMGGANLLAPYLLNGMMGGGGGMFPGMGGGIGGMFSNFGANLGMGGSGGIPGLQGGSPLIGGGLPGSQLGGGMGLMPNLAMGGAGMLAGQQVFGNNMYSNIGGVAGGIGGSMFGPVGSALGSFAGEGIGNALHNMSPSTRAAIQSGGLSLAVKPLESVGKSIGNAVSSVFPF